MAIFNQYSYVFTAVVGGLMLAAGLWLWKGPAPGLRAALMAAYLLGAIGVHFALRYRSSEGAANADAVEKALANGRPTLVMLYSNY
jgi:hypothetical protein